MTKQFAAAAALFIAGCAQSFALPVLYGTVGMGGTPSTLVRLDPTTGAVVQTIGAIGYSVNGLAWDASTGTLFATTGVNDSVFNGLISINTTTGAGTQIGPNQWGTGSSQAIVTLASFGGNLYGWWDPSQDDLVSIDKNLGTFTRVGEASVSTGGQGLAFDNFGTLYLHNGGNFYTVNTTTGATTYTVTTNQTAHHGDFNPDTGYYYGISNSGPGSKDIYVIDATTGATLSTLSTVNDLHTLAFVDSSAVPEPGTWALMGLGLASVVGLRRRKA